MHQLTPEQFFAAAVAAESARPFVTYYDEASGERTELSVHSLANWVAKTHFLLVDELGLGVGDAALIAVPAHWISAPIVLGCLTAGLRLTTDVGDASVGFVTPESAASAAGVPDVYAVAPSSAALGVRDGMPDGVEDYVAAVRPQADAWSSVHLAAHDDDAAFDGVTRDALVERARGRAEQLRVGDAGRVLTTRDWSTADDLVDTFFVPLVVGGSVVYVRNAADEQTIERRVAQERASVRV